MTKNQTLLFVTILLVSVFIYSCVPTKQFQEIKSKKEKTDNENVQLRSQVQEMTTKSTEQAGTIDQFNKKIKNLQTDTLNIGKSFRKNISDYESLDKTYQGLLQKYAQISTGNNTETQKLTSKLQETLEDLQRREDEVKKMDKELEIKKNNLNNLNKELIKYQDDLDKKEKRLLELQNILSKKDSVVKILKKKVSEALLGFENKGLTVNQKNGKVNVSLEESLLFASGSFELSANGIDALKKLAKVLENNPDVNILVEGHTDNVPYKGSGQVKDNWDLSVMRATEVARILLQNSKIDPKRLTAAGRSEYLPVSLESTKESRNKNRRTEIYLTPRLDELFRIIDSN